MGSYSFKIYDDKAIMLLMLRLENNFYFFHHGITAVSHFEGPRNG